MSGEVLNERGTCGEGRKDTSNCKLAASVPRDWNIPAAFWSCGQPKTFLGRSPSCFLCALHGIHVPRQAVSISTCGVEQAEQ